MLDELEPRRSRPDAPEVVPCGCTAAPRDATSADPDPLARAEPPETTSAALAEPETEATPSDAADELKLVVSIRAGRSTIGVQRPASDPHLESDDALDLTALLERIPGVLERAQARWRDAPRHPGYARPAPPARRGGRRGQPASPGSVDDPETAAAQQQTLQLF